MTATMTPRSEAALRTILDCIERDDELTPEQARQT
jgi:hypothetical protein